MITASYNYITTPNTTEYFFLSEGSKGTILKWVEFTPMGNDLWNLAFGDVIDGETNDNVISNNHDFVKLFNTIAKITYEFTDQFPNREIQIIPVDEKRKKLYNYIFRKNYEHISPYFHITGFFFNGKSENYKPEKNYETFELKRKFVQ